VEFGATSAVFPVLHGVGHIDRMEAPEAPDGAVVRWPDPSFARSGKGTWRIWWSSTRAPGRLDPPVVGRFTDGRGVFQCEDVVGGRPVRLRFEWLADRPSPRWQQSFS
jgi:hypothetical protein